MHPEQRIVHFNPALTQQHFDFLSFHANIHHPKNHFPAAEQPEAKNVKDPQKAQALLPKTVCLTGHLKKEVKQ